MVTDSTANSTAQSTVIQATDLHRSYRLGKKRVPVLQGVDLSISRGETAFLCGASGAGKTTLMYTLAGLERPEQGQVTIKGQDLYGIPSKAQSALRNAEIGYIFQNYFLLPELTALENVLIPGLIGDNADPLLAEAALERVGLAKRLNHLPAELSGGEQQRVAIARAIVNSPSIIFADEPTGNLDSKNGEEVISLLLELVQEKQATLVVVTHDQELAKRGDRILTIKDGKMT